LFVLLLVFVVLCFSVFFFSNAAFIATQDLAVQQIFSSIDLFLSYRTDFTDSRTI